MEPDIKELYFCCTKYNIILEVMDNPAAEANAMRNFQKELDELVSKGAHTRACKDYEDLDSHLEKLREALREKFPRIAINF